MFEALRKMIFPIIIVVLFFFVAMIILQWGLGMSSRQGFESANVAGAVNGEEISWQAYNRLYNNLVQVEVAKLEEDAELPDAKIKELQQNAWNQILGERLMLQEAAKHQIVVTDEEVYQYLREAPPTDFQTHPNFQTDGKFDYRKYLSALADPQYASVWNSMEPYLRNEILKTKLQLMLIETADVTEAEIRESYFAQAERVKVGMINVGFDRFSAPPPTSTDEEYQQWFEDHKEDYSMPDRAALNLVILPKDPGRYDWEEAFNQAKSIYDQIQDGADFKALAKDLSEDPGSARDSGSLGWFASGRMVEEFDRAAFSMKEGEVSEPIRTQFGWHIIKHHGYRDTVKTVQGKQETVKEANCSHILIKANASRETLDGLYQRMVEFESAAKEKGFFAAAEEMSLPVDNSGPFERGGSIKKLGQHQGAGDFAFENDERSISAVMENSASYFVAEVAKRIPAGPPEYEEVKARVRAALQKDKVLTLCHDTADAIWADFKAGMSPKQAAEKHGEEYELPAEFGRGSYVKGIGRSAEAFGAAFSLTEPGQVSAPIEFDQGVVIFELLERTQPDLTEFTAKRDSLRTSLTQAKQQELLGRWYENLVKNSEIVNNVERMGEQPDLY
ncbi:MAG: peptidylprolyl isomerase [bacterium]